MRLRILGLMAVPVLIGAAPFLGATDARAALSFTATASADVVHLTYVVKDAPVSETIFAGGSPSASAVLDALGNSTAIAAASNPGDQLTSLPNTARGLYPQLAALPDWPYFAVSRSPSTPVATQEVGPYLLKAESEPDRSVATAGGDTVHESGVVIGRATSLAETSTDGNKVTSRATTLATGISVAAIEIGAVKSVASMTSDGKEPTQASDLLVTGVSVAGVPLAFGPEGFMLPGQNTPLPDSSPILKPLAEQGIKVRYLEPITTKDSVLTAGIEISSLWNPPDGSPFGTVTQSLTLGRSYVSLNATGSGGDAFSPAAPATDAGVDSAATPDLGALPTTDGAAVPGALPGELPGSTPTGAVPGNTVPTVQVAPAGLTQPDGFDLNLFPPFVVAALGVLLLGQLLRYRGVRQS
ncbi:hypothetical protein [Sporichthya brevicatena]